MDDNRIPPIIAVWAPDEDAPDAIRLFTPDEYADWGETNELTDAYPHPTTFYGTTGDGHLVELAHTVTVGAYDVQDYATVTHTWEDPNIHSGVYATGISRRDGRA